MPWRDVKVSDTPTEAGDRTVLWIGALSFEERCTASLARLLKVSQPPAAAVLFDYPTVVYPASQDRDRRRRNRKLLEDACGRASPAVPLNVMTVEPYSYRAAQRAVRKQIDALQPDQVVLDLSCLTKIHVIALTHPAIFASNRDWELAYTMPETYGHLETSKDTGGGWRDVLVLPVGEPLEILNESEARGVVLAGHEGDRLIIALSELEPASGVIVSARADGRPDLRSRTEHRNLLMTQLLTSRGPGRWATEAVSVRDPRSLAEVVESQVSHARAAGAPAFLYPFGPKPFVALTAMQLASAAELASWFVYPIPNSYDVDYSYGVGPVTWYSKRATPSVAAQGALPVTR